MNAVKFLKLCEKMHSAYKNKCENCPAYSEKYICALNIEEPEENIKIVKKWAKDNHIIDILGRIKK